MSETKRRAAEKALDFLEDGMVVGVGTGSTVAYFIAALQQHAHRIQGAVASSKETATRLAQANIPIIDFNHISHLPLYVDGADECDPNKCLIKGGGGALTREKILAQASKRFVCIIDPTKQVAVLGKFPLPIEVIPMARSAVARTVLEQTGGQPTWRQGVITDNGNVILDVHHLSISQPRQLEQELNQIPGIVSVGLFAQRRADIVLVGTDPPQCLE